MVSRWISARCVRRGEAPADGWPVLDGQLDAFAELVEDPADDELPDAFRLVVICPPCDTTIEATWDELPDVCPICGGPVITGEIASRAPDRARSV